MRDVAKVPWHSMDIQEVLRKLQTSTTGLSEDEALRRLKIYGYNELERKRVSALSIFARQFMSFLILILIIACIIALALGEFIDACTILAIVLLMGIMGFVQEYRAEKTLEKLQELASPVARVVRNGAITTVQARELVPGDIVLLREGDRVPADCRLIETEDLEVDESPLTGESTPVEKVADVVLPPETPIHDRKNMVFMGTYVVRGRGKAVVVSTGMNTELGKIAKQIQQVPYEKTLLEKELDVFGKRIGIILVAICIVIFIVSVVVRSEPIVDSLLLAVALAVAAIPEGLPAIATIVLALGAWRMAQRNALVKRLAAVETLGACNVICSDKTGTITKGEMTVKKIWIYDKYFEVEGVGYEPRGSVKSLDEVTRRLLQELCKYLAAHTSIDASIEFRDGKWIASGSPTEASALVLAYKVLGGQGVENAKKSLPIIRTIPFDRFRKRKTTLHRYQGRVLVVSSGAPESILELSNYILRSDGRVVKLDNDLKSYVLKTVNDLARSGFRTYAMAYKYVDEVEENPEHDLIFAILMGIIDPPREEVRRAIEIAKRAGIKVIMVTGDHKLTAVAIANMIGLDTENGLVVEGRELDKMSDEELEKIIDRVVIFARVTPDHKARIVKALKRRGYVVAMTGDGVNDAPALKLADIGIAMGIRGTDVAKEASQLILLDDNFATIVEAIKEGRIIYENLKKPINYLLTCNLGEVVTIFGSELMGLPPALTAAQLLWINITTDALPALALGVEPPEPGIMERPPRGKEIGLITNRKIMYYIFMGSLLGLAVLGVYSYLMNLGIEIARTAAFTSIAFSEFGRAFASRSENLPIWKLRFNKWLVPAVLASAALQLMVVYITPLTAIFKTVPLPIHTFLLIAVVPCIVFIADEIRKLLKIRI